MCLGALTLAPPGPPSRDGAGPRERAGGEEEPEEVAAPVMVGQASRGSIEATVSSASTIEAERQVVVTAEAMGRVTRVLVEEADEVEGSALLATLYRDSQSTMLERADVSVDTAKRDLERIRSLFSKGAASEEEVQIAEVALRNAKLDLRDRRRDVRDTNVRAPFDGVVTERFVSAGATVSVGAQLFSITDFDSLVARIFVSERDLDRISIGQPARVVSKAARGREVQGEVVRIAPIVDATTGTVKVTIHLPEQHPASPEGSAGSAKAGKGAAASLGAELVAALVDCPSQGAASRSCRACTRRSR